MGSELTAGADAQFRVDVLQVALNGVNAYDQTGRDLLVRQPCGSEFGDPGFRRCENALA